MFLQTCHRAESMWQWAEALSKAKPARLGRGAQGRVLRVDGELAGRPVSLVSVYAPAQQAERPAFYAECLPACLPPAADRRLLLIGGDFNGPTSEVKGRALQGCSHSKALGLDGMPMEVYDRLWLELGRPMLSMLQEALADTADPAPLAEFLTGIITLVPKAGKPRDQVASYAPSRSSTALGPRAPWGVREQGGEQQQGGEQDPDVVIPAVRAGVLVRHLGVLLGTASYAATNEAAYGGAIAAMMAASIPWRPQASGNQATILDDDNWPIWSIRTEGLLIEAGLWSVVADGVTPLPTAPAANATQQEQTAYAAELARSRADSALDRKAKAFIQRHVSNLHIFTVKSADSAQDAWETLESQFTESSVARQSQLQQQLSLLRMEPGESVARFYARLQQLLTELEACNCETSESTVVLAILAALPPEYESTVERLRYDQTSADLKVERIKRVLLTKEADLLSKQMQQQLSTSSSSLWSYSSPSDSRGAGSSGGQGGRGRFRLPQQSREQQAAQQQQARAQSPDRSTRDVSSHAHLTCNYCAKPGHIMSECFTFDRDQRNRMRTLFSNPARPSSPGRRPSPGRSSSPARTSSPSRGRAQTPGRTAAQSPSRGASLFTCSTAAAADDDDDDLDDVLMQMVQPRLNFNSDLYSPFCIDSGASQHILKDLQFFYNYTPFAPDKHKPVRLAAEGHRVWAVGSGSVFLSTKRGSWFLSHALYVPDSKQNFISVTAATDDGSSFLFRGDVCQISCNQFGSMLRVNAHKVRNSYILAAVPMPDGPDTDSEQEQLYGIQQSALQPDPRVKLELLTNVAAPSANSATSNSPQVWHQRLCHTSYDALARMQSAGMVSGVPVTAAQFRAAASDPAVCVGCVKGKQHKNVAFAGPPPNAAPVTAPLGLIHMDVCGPMHARARDGSLYVATFLDEHTKLSVCVPISSKAQVPDTVRTVIEELETQSGYRCKAIRTDNGTEYVNSRMREYCASKGIVHQHSAPYSPQQNGAAERLNRTIFEKARSIIHSADISLSFWAHAVKFSNHVRCLLPVSGQPLTPWEAFYGVKPDLSGLRVFGCRVWLHIPDHQRSKLQAKSVEGLFIGYEPGSKAYRVLVNGRETCSKDIVFDELSVLQPTRQQDQPAQPVFLLPLPPSPNTPSEPLSPAAPAEGGNSLQQTSSSSSEDSGSSSSISRPGSSAQRPQSRPLEGIGAHQDSSSSDSPPSEQEPSQQVSLTARYEPGSHIQGDSGSKTTSTSSCSISSTSSSKASSTSRSISSTSSCSISSTSNCKTCSISSSKASSTSCSISSSKVSSTSCSISSSKASSTSCSISSSKASSTSCSICSSKASSTSCSTFSSQTCSTNSSTNHAPISTHACCT
ncbi:hypothetical protein QJQ45_024410 [Haematococcus lacustris]|nr:hypothetical protein QJQ45_024410 [Haematococcus lacustris]